MLLSAEESRHGGGVAAFPKHFQKRCGTGHGMLTLVNEHVDGSLLPSVSNIGVANVTLTSVRCTDKWEKADGLRQNQRVLDVNSIEKYEDRGADKVEQ